MQALYTLREHQIEANHYRQQGDILPIIGRAVKLRFG
jgi:hypothetical protein